MASFFSFSFLISFLFSFAYCDPYILSSELSGTTSLLIYSSSSYSMHQRSEISLNHNYSSLATSIYDREGSQIQNITEQIFMDPLAYLKIKPSEFYKNTTIVNISLYFTSEPRADRFIGMGHFFENKNFSLIAQLYNKGYIKRQQFALEILSNGIRDNYIYFGGIPHKLLSYKQQTQVLRAIEGQIPWVFQIDALLTRNGHVLNVQRVVYFTLDQNYFIVDKEVYEWLREDVFGELLMDGFCKERISVSNKGEVNGRLQCSKNVRDEYEQPEIYFSHDGQHIPLLYNDIEGSNFFDIYFEYSNELDNKKQIFFPKNFFSNRVVLFDYDKHLITLHTSKIRSENYNENVKRNVNNRNDKHRESFQSNKNVIKVLLGVMTLCLGTIVFGVVVVKNGNYEMLFK